MANNLDTNETTPKGAKTMFQVLVEKEHVKMLKVIAKSYRIPNNMSHAIRLMIEDKYESLKAAGQE